MLQLIKEMLRIIQYKVFQESIKYKKIMKLVQKQDKIYKMLLNKFVRFLSIKIKEPKKLQKENKMMKKN